LIEQEKIVNNNRKVARDIDFESY